MDANEINAIVEQTQMIVCGYAFSQTDEGFVRVVNLHAPHHALVMTQDGEPLEKDMDDIEISIVSRYWCRNKKTLEGAYAKVL